MDSQFFPLEQLRARFYLRSPKSSKPTDLYLLVSHKRDRFRFYTQLKLYPHHWDSRNEKAMISTYLTNTDNYNNNIVNKGLDIYKEKINSIKSFLCNNPHSILNLQSILRDNFSMIKNKDKIEEININSILYTGINELNIAEGTKDNYKKVLPDFNEFIKGKNIISFNQINNELFAQYCNWYAQKYKGKYLVRTVNDNLNYLRSAIVQVGKVKNLLTKTERKNIEFDRFEDKTPDNKIALHDYEVMAIYNYKAVNEVEDRVRDLFLVECLVGVRFQDIMQLSKDNVTVTQDVESINIKVRKGQKPLKVMFYYDLAKRIIADKYRYNLPKENKKTVNKVIKEICKKIGGDFLKKEKEYYHYIGESESKEVIRQRYERVSTHTGRRTFVTSLSLRGVSHQDITRKTGQTLPMVELYDKKDGEFEKIYKKTLKNNPELILKTLEDEK